VVNKLRVLKFVFLVGFFAFQISSYAHAQDDKENFYERIATCAAGAGFDLSADLRGSLESVFSGDSTQGKSSVDLRTEWLKLFPPEDRIEAAKLYHDCIEKYFSQNESKLESMFLLVCSIDIENNNNLRISTEPPSPVNKEALRRLAQQMFSMPKGFSEFYVTKDYVVYRKNRKNDYVKGGSFRQDDWKDQLEAYRSSKMSVNFSNFLTFKKVNSRSFSKIRDLKNAEMHAMLYQTSNGEIEAHLRMDAVIARTNEKFAMKMFFTLATCEYF